MLADLLPGRSVWCMPTIVSSFWHNILIWEHDLDYICSYLFLVQLVIACSFARAFCSDSLAAMSDTTSKQPAAARSSRSGYGPLLQVALYIKNKSEILMYFTDGGVQPLLEQEILAQAEISLPRCLLICQDAKNL